MQENDYIHIILKIYGLRIQKIYKKFGMQYSKSYQFVDRRASNHSPNREVKHGVSDRTETRILSIIRSHSLPDSIVIPDGFCIYCNFEIYYTDSTVNHDITFRDPVTGSPENTIE
ncbi:hypothetical protein HZS_1387 [Henneguya salminicola]|nr:hypothetical protein HZS_1387 [Henneguya salminicola]